MSTISPIWPDLVTDDKQASATTTDTTLDVRETSDPELGTLDTTVSSSPPRPQLWPAILAYIHPPLPPDADHAGPPPDGGWAAWSTCVCAHLVFSNTWGFVNSFGIFQTFYADFLAPPQPPSTISWIGSVQVFLAFFLSAVTGRLGDAGYFRSCCRRAWPWAWRRGS
ncbi:hypothetical protein SCUCBS95973_009307 [Sporothrix curviconia]|uniref:Major facilitator superfamily transporter n=1 Tax=Sporothrix curviconia TaxID=1260050 RepID=A0ABP0CTU2_9PEZI